MAIRTLPDDAKMEEIIDTIGEAAEVIADYRSIYDVN